MAAARFARQYRFHGGREQVTLFGAEPRLPYNRVLLADVLAGRYAPADIALPTGDVEVRTGAEVVGLDTRRRCLRLADGTCHRYGTLVLATGANPVLPPLRGLRTSGGRLLGATHALRTLADCARLRSDAAVARRAVVVGGGVLGVGAACALAALGLAVEIVHQAPHLVERHLDAGAGDALRRGLRRLGVETYSDNRVRALEGTGRVHAVRLADGHRLTTDLVVLACGVRPRTGLAHAAGLPVGRGVLVDDTLACTPDDAGRTDVTDVYAIGDCAEHRGTLYGLAGPAWEQADALAARLSGAVPDARYTGSRPLSRLTAGPLQYACFGDLDETAPGTEVLRLTDATRGTYKKLLSHGDRLVGAVLLGDLDSVGALGRAFERDEPLPEDPLTLLTTQGER
jgi:assimilatory nitrate reductase electron transfer subunit